ncbi:hypothetical protein CVT91_01570 [Candidatus Atribacteria bacterium HGW-Atribacteria-1]|nr:MAG: hypothetical protein CVT91_01570 [Candidatus Atribacteria bacterium HGW-Atribacteria-1]
MKNKKCFTKHVLHTLKGGLKVILIKIPSLSTVTLSIAVRAGSHFESKEVNGISHLLEHIIFRGSKKRKSKALLYNPIESYGARMGGMTKCECSTFYVQGMNCYLQKYIDILFDIFFNPLFLNIDIEKEVILKEIYTYSTTSMHFTFQKICSFFYPNHRFSLPVLGTKNSVSKMDESTLRSTHAKFYRNLSNIAIAISGKFNSRSVLKCIKDNTPSKEKCSNFHVVQEVSVKPKNGPGVITKLCNTNLAYLCLGFLCSFLKDTEIEIFELLNVLIGGYTNSRITKRFREGLAYTAYSKVATFHNWGLFAINVEVLNDQVIPAIDIIVSELNDLKYNILSCKDLQLVKNVYEGQIKLRLDDHFKATIWAAEEILKSRNYRLPTLIVDKVRNITAHDVQQLARKMFLPTNVCCVVIGSAVQKDKILDRLFCLS